MSQMNFEETSFRNLVLFYADELKELNNGKPMLTPSEKRALCKHGVCHRQNTKKGRYFTGAVSALTQRARNVLEEAEAEQ